MKHVKQRHATTCGPACFAMVTNLSYTDAIRILHPRGPHRKTTCGHDASSALKYVRWCYCTSPERILKGFEKFGMQSRLVMTIYPDDMPDPIIMSIGWKNFTHKHWVVWDPDIRIVRDPGWTEVEMPNKRRDYYTNRFELSHTGGIIVKR